MDRAFRVGRFAGIQWNVHWTFLLFVGWVSAMQWLVNGFGSAMWEQVVFGGMVSICLVAHELGHVLVGLQFGIQTQEITLLPTGGLSRSREVSGDLWTELCIACAGPLVHVLIALGIAAVLAAQGNSLVVSSFGWIGTSASDQFWQQMVFVNLSLATINLIPALPLDGGRV